MGPGAGGTGGAVWVALCVAVVVPGVWMGCVGIWLVVLLHGVVGNVAGREVWLLGWVVSSAVGLTVDGWVMVVWAGGLSVADCEPGAALEPIVASVT